jgi:xylulokinase
MFINEQNRRVTSAFHAALGVDIGTTNTKVVVAEIASDGSVRSAHSQTIPTPSDGSALRDAVLASIKKVAAEYAAGAAGAAGTAAAANPIEAVGIASMAETGALLGPDGEPRGALLRWNDSHSRVADDLVASVGAEALYAATGVPVVAKTPIAHWLRLRDQDDSRLRDARWAGAADLVAFALTGALATDHTLAARTLGYRSVPVGSPLPRAFDPELLALAGPAGISGLSPDRMPEVLEPGTPAGSVTSAAASATGLTAGIPVFIAGHDHAVGAWAAGARASGDAADSVGTAEALFRVSAAPVPREAARRAGMSVARTVDGRHESLVAGNPTAGALVEWAFQTIWPGAEREATQAAAARIGALRGDVLVLPFLRGRQSPAPDPRAVFRVVDRAGETASLPADAGEALVAVLSGLVLQLAWMDAAQSVVLEAPRASGLRVIGGPGAADGAWWSLKQAILPGGLTRVDAAEPVALGAALLAARSVTGLEPVLPGRASPSRTSAADELLSDPEQLSVAELLSDYVAAATRATEKEHR